MFEGGFCLTVRIFCACIFLDRESCSQDTAKLEKTTGYKTVFKQPFKNKYMHGKICTEKKIVEIQPICHWRVSAPAQGGERVYLIIALSAALCPPPSGPRWDRHNVRPQQILSKNNWVSRSRVPDGFHLVLRFVFIFFLVILHCWVMKIKSKVFFFFFHLT